MALSKPIIVIKAGRTEQAAKAAASHTGSLTGSDEVLNAAFRRSGVLRVQNIADLFYMAEVLATATPQGAAVDDRNQCRRAGRAGDRCADRSRRPVAPLADTTITAFNELLPPHWSHNNPVDILGDAGPDRYAKALEIAAADPNSDGMLVILTPQDMTDATLTAEALKKHAKIEGKPVLASWMGGPTTQAGVAILNTAGIPTFDFPDTAARAFHYMWRYTYHLRGLYETPMLDDETDHLDRATADAVISGASARASRCWTSSTANGCSRRTVFPRSGRPSLAPTTKP